MTQAISGYTLGTAAMAPSPLTMEDFELMKKTALFGDDDIKALRASYDIVKDHVEEILDVWYGFVGANPHLLASFVNPRDGQPVTAYLEAVRRRFGQWILDTARADYDERWLAYQHEIGLRHYRTKKNRTDGVQAADIVPLRYLAPLVVPITFTLKPFLSKAGHAPDDVERMHAAWLKSCLLQVTLWSYPYVSARDF